MNEPLPFSRDMFDMYMKHFFPRVLDIKSYQHEFSFDGGLNRLADCLNIKRVGTMHQAGSDSLVTVQVFFQILEESREESKQLLNTVLNDYNLDIYGFSNDQAFPTISGRAPVNYNSSAMNNMGGEGQLHHH